MDSFAFPLEFFLMHLFGSTSYTSELMFASLDSIQAAVTWLCSKYLEEKKYLSSLLRYCLLASKLQHTGYYFECVIFRGGLFGFCSNNSVNVLILYFLTVCCCSSKL